MGAGTVGAALGPRGQCWPRATPEEAEGQLPAAQLHAFTEGSSRFSAGTSRSHWAALSQSCHPLQRASSARALSCPAMRRKERELPLPYERPAQTQLCTILQAAEAEPRPHEDHCALPPDVPLVARRAGAWETRGTERGREEGRTPRADWPGLLGPDTEPRWPGQTPS